MEFLQLKYFCHAAESENFSKTAETFGVPPSCISQSIKRLEKELSVQLFTRSANKITLNDRGTEFYQKISEGLNIINNAATAVSDDGQKGDLQICINSNRRIVMQAVENFKKLFPNVNITTKYLTYDFSDKFDIIIDSENDSLSGFNKRLLLTEPLCVAVSKNNPLTKTPFFNMSALADQPFISTNNQSALYAITKQICSKFGFDPNIAVVSDDPFYIRQYVELGLAVTVAPMYSWLGQFSENIKFYPLENCFRNTFIYTTQKKYIPICAKNFIKHLIDECNADFNHV